MRNTLPSLTALRAFEVVGRNGSLRRAAADLEVSHSAVGRQMRDLEHWFGAKLVHTTSRGSELTCEGKRLHEFVSPAFELLAQGVADLRPPKGVRSLRVWCTPGLASHWITPRLADVKARLPRVEFRLTPSEKAASFQRNEADLEIRFGARTEAGLVSERIASPKILVVASPDWVRQNPRCRDLSGLLECELLHESSTEWWRLWFERAGCKVSAKLPGVCVGSLPAAIAAAMAGHGAALVTEPLVRNQIAEGALEVVWDLGLVLGDYVAVTRLERAGERAIVQFRRWLTESMASPTESIKPGDRLRRSG